MSFGFKKKIYTTNKKNGNSTKEKEKLSQEEQFASIRTDNGGDDNGNQGTLLTTSNVAKSSVNGFFLQEDWMYLVIKNRDELLPD